MPLQEFQAWIAQYGYGAIFFLLMLGIVGLPVPDETLLTLTGYLVFKGNLQLIPGSVAALLGTVTGITISYCIGRIGGARFLHRFGARLHIRGESVDRVHSWFRRWGHWSLTIGYFVPGVRHLIAIVAGSSGLEYTTFGLFAYGGALVWAGIFISAGYYLGDGWEAFPETMTSIGIRVFAAAIAASLGYWGYRPYRRRRKEG